MLNHHLPAPSGCFARPGGGRRGMGEFKISVPILFLLFSHLEIINTKDKGLLQITYLVSKWSF
jgi:hypothetical protein